MSPLTEVDSGYVWVPPLEAAEEMSLDELDEIYDVFDERYQHLAEETCEQILEAVREESGEEQYR